MPDLVLGKVRKNQRPSSHRFFAIAKEIGFNILVKNSKTEITTASKLWFSHKNVVFSAHVGMRNAMYISSIKGNSISGLRSL